MVPYSEVPARIKESMLLSHKVEACGISLRRQGREWVGLCPFHDEKTPSFSVNDEKGVYLCRGCHATGDVISFQAQFLSISPGEAIKALASELGLAVAPSPHSNHKRREPANPPAITTWNDDVLLALNRAAFSVFLTSGQRSDRFAQVLAERNIDQFSARAFGLGFFPFTLSLVAEIGRHEALAGLTKEQVRAGCRELGLLHRHNDASPFQGRLIFPITNGSGDVVAFSGRELDAGDGPKYLNSPDSQVFDKSSVLYGLAPCHELVSGSAEIRQYWQPLTSQTTVYLVEGYTDVIALAKRGHFAVAAMGTGLSERQIRLILRSAKRVVCLYDGDSAGQRAFKRSMLALFPHLTDSHRLYALQLPQEHDPDSYLQSHDDDAEAALQSLPRQQPESIWWDHYVGSVSRRPGLADQVQIERAWANKDSYPQTPLWQLMLARRIQQVAGYRLRDPGQPIALPPWYHSLSAGQTFSVDDPTLAIWVNRLQACPGSVVPLIVPYLRRWWVADLLHGRLHEGVPSGIVSLFAAGWCLHDQPVNDWPDMVGRLLEQGFPAHWLKSWLNTPVASGELSPDDRTLHFEWDTWLESIDQSLTNRLLQAVTSASASQTND